MGGFFATASKEDCVFDLFFGVDYHSHLGAQVLPCTMKKAGLKGRYTI